MKRIIKKIIKHVLLKPDRKGKDTLNYLKRYLNKNQNLSCLSPLKDIKPCIWTLWLQGYDNAPPIVKRCFDYMFKYANGYEVIILTEKTISDYISMPDFIVKKYKAQIIPAAHYSDLIRTLLLINYGGLWLDSTCLLTKPVPQNILDSQLFMFQTPILKKEVILGSNWFIAYKRNNYVLLKVFEILVAYWNDNSYVTNYFLYHIAIAAVVTYDENAKKIWLEMFYRNNSDPHILQKKLFDAYDARMKDYIWDFVFVHKLSYKFRKSTLLWQETREVPYSRATEIPNTFYQYILNPEKF